MKEKNFNIEVLRGVLMIWIVLFHYTTRFKELFGYSTFAYEFQRGGEIGVTFFFIISGYLFYSSLLRVNKQSLLNVGKFCINKYWRLYPAYLVSIILIFILYQFVDLAGRECSLRDFIVNSIFIFHPGFSYVDSAHWFIAILIKLQFISAIFLLFKPSTRNHVILAFEIFVITLLMCKTFVNFEILRYIDFVFSSNCFLKFLMGYNLYMIQSISSSKGIKYIYIILSLLIIGYYSYTINFALIFSYTIITYLVLQDKYKFVHKYCYPLIVVGKYSFVWYLVHQNIGFIILMQLTKWGIKSEISILIPMIVTFGIAIFIQKMIDKLPSKLFSI